MQLSKCAKCAKLHFFSQGSPLLKKKIKNYYSYHLYRLCIPGTAIVHSSHLNVSLGRDGMPTPAMLAARTWNWYSMFSFSSET